jgi:hypothetical protein
MRQVACFCVQCYALRLWIWNRERMFCWGVGWAPSHCVTGFLCTTSPVDIWWGGSQIRFKNYLRTYLNHFLSLNTSKPSRGWCSRICWCIPSRIRYLKTKVAICGQDTHLWRLLGWPLRKMHERVKNKLTRKVRAHFFIAFKIDTVAGKKSTSCDFRFRLQQLAHRSFF